MAAVRDDVQSGYPGDIVERWSKIYGNIFQCDFSTTSLVVNTEPEHIKAILTSHFDDFEKGPILGSILDSLFGTGVFNADGNTWRFHRAMARPFFTRARLGNFNIYDRKSTLALSHVRERVAEGYSVNIQDLVARFTLDSASEFLFGRNIDTLSAGISYPSYAEHKTPQSFYTHPSNAYANVFSKSQTNTLIRFALGPDWPLAEFFKDSIAPMRV